MIDFLSILSNLLYGPLIGAVAGLTLTFIHARGTKLPIIEQLLNWVINAEGKPVPALISVTPLVPVSPSGHPILDALNHILGGVLAGRQVANVSASTAPDGNTVNATVSLVPK